MLRVKRQKLFSLLPFIVLCVVILYTCVEIIATDYAASLRHYLAMAIMFCNGVLYFTKYRLAIIFTGIILILATFDMLAFFSVVKTYYWSVNIADKSISTPGIQLVPLIVLVVYCLINFNLLIDCYIDYMDTKKTDI